LIAMTIQEEQETTQTTSAIRSYFRELKSRAILDEINVKDTLGLGTFGRVRLLEVPKLRDHLQKQEIPRVHAQNCFFAIKIMKKSEIIRLKQVDHVMSERSILQDVSHPFIVVAYHTFQDERNLYMLMDYVAGGTLISHLRKQAKFSAEHTRFYAAQIVMALQYLHQLGIVYRDLRPENLLLDTSGYMKMVDFGYAKRINDVTWTLVGTPEYLAPEIIQSKGHNKAVDWWALGILIYEMMAGYPPYYDENPFGIYQKILSGKLEFPRHFDVHSRDLIRKLLTADRTKRIGSLKNGAEDIKKHKWYRGLNWAALYNKQMEAFITCNVKSQDDTSLFDKYTDSVEESGPLINPAKDKELFSTFDEDF